MDYSFPVEDPVKYQVTDRKSGEILNLKTFLYPAYFDAKEQEGGLNDGPKNPLDMDEARDLKGIVFFVHGFTDYSGRMAHVGQRFSELGYDFYSMDQRGHGKSDG
jgi:alpha-beta hydrolase superfamily lysophospholipase